MKKLRESHAWTVVDTDGRVIWGLAERDKEFVSRMAKHPRRMVARVEVVAIVRKKLGRKRRNK